MLRSFKKFTIVAGGTPQPLIGTTLTAAVGPVAKPGDFVGASGQFTLPIADSSIFLPGDWLVLGKPSTGEERFQVLSVPTTTSVVILIPTTTPNWGIKNTYASGSYVRLGSVTNSTYIQTTQANAGPIYVGTKDTMVKATQAFCVALLYNQASPIQPIDFHDGRSGLANCETIGQIWVDGTTGDGYLPSMGVM